MVKLVQSVLILMSLFVLDVSPSVAGVNTFSQASDRLAAVVFGGEDIEGDVYGKENTVEGRVSVTTEKGEEYIGDGPGWVYYLVDRETPNFLGRIILVRQEGDVRIKRIKHPIVSLEGYSNVATDLAGAEAAGSLPELTSEGQAYDWLVDELLGHSAKGVLVYFLQYVESGGAAVENWREKIVLGSGPGWIFFVDDRPGANWEHSARFVFVASDGTITVKKSSTPPGNMFLGEPLNKEDAFSSDLQAPASSVSVPQMLNTVSGAGANATPAANRWAVILSGGYNKYSNHPRYYNDCVYFYNTLKAHGFLDSQIYVLMADGTDPAVDRSDEVNSDPDLDGDGDADIQYSATRANISTVFNELAGRLDGDDLLYIFTTDHGGNGDGNDAPYYDPDAVLWLWGEGITDAAFANEVNKVDTLATVGIFEQCFSGGMIDDLEGANRVLMSASRWWELSYAMSLAYDEFSYYVTYALAQPEVVDLNGDGVTSMEEAYLHALQNDSRQSEMLYSDGSNIGEHPSYYSNPPGLGNMISLNGIDTSADRPVLGGTEENISEEGFEFCGTVRDWYGDDEAYSYALPFTFSYHGTDYDTVYVGTNGVISFDAAFIENANTVDGLCINKLVAPLWDDLTVNADDGDAVFVEESSEEVTIRWKAHTYIDMRPVNFSATLEKDGTVTFKYGSDLNLIGRLAGRDRSIGLSGESYTNAHLSILNGEQSLGNAASVVFSAPSSDGGDISTLIRMLLLD